MASNSALDVDKLLAPISPDEPCGVPLPASAGVLAQLEDAANSQDIFDPNTGKSIHKDADWEAVFQLATEALTTQSKHLKCAAYLVYATAHLRGLAGLRDGLHFLNRLIEQYWTQLHPRPAPDNSASAGDLDGLYDGASFERRRIALDNLILWLKEDIEKGVLTSNTNGQTASTPSDLAAAAEEVGTLAQRLRDPDKFGGALSGVAALEKALAARVLTPDLPASVARLSPAVDGSRTELLTQLSKCADTFRQTEPHSPIAMVIDYAVGLGSMKFETLMDEHEPLGQIRERLKRMNGSGHETS
jgi:type VI secretion system protein ImpA